MIFAGLIAGTLLVPASLERDVPQMLEPGMTMPAEQKEAAARPLISSATECIARTVSADPRFKSSLGGIAFNELIVASVPSCVEPLRAMIHTYDRLYGDGAGEAFFLGPYLDSLPAAVTRRVKSPH